MKYKIQYEILAINIDKLYPPHYVLKQGETIDQHLMDIEAFIESCGWSPQEYIEEYIRRGLETLLPNLKKEN